MRKIKSWFEVSATFGFGFSSHTVSIDDQSCLLKYDIWFFPFFSYIEVYAIRKYN